MNGCTEIFVKHGTGVIGTLLRSITNGFEIRAAHIDGLDLNPFAASEFQMTLDGIFKSKFPVTTILITDLQSSPPRVKKFIDDLIFTRTFHGKRIPDQVVFIKVNYI